MTATQAMILATQPLALFSPAADCVTQSNELSGDNGVRVGAANLRLRHVDLGLLDRREQRRLDETARRRTFAATDGNDRFC